MYTASQDGLDTWGGRVLAAVPQERRGLIFVFRMHISSLLVNTAFSLMVKLDVQCLIVNKLAVSVSTK